MPSRISLPAVSVDPLPEKNREGKMIDPKSTIEAAAIQLTEVGAAGCRSPLL